MSALAVFFEREGIATVVIGLLRLHLEKIRPPRALWVPFELGRPLGGFIDDGQFQKKVLRSALGLLKRTDGPVILEDFPLEDPGAWADPAWLPPQLPKGLTLEGEVHALWPQWQQARHYLGQTQLGLSGLAIDQVADYLARFSTGKSPTNPDNTMSANLRLRFCADDIKAYYCEAALVATQSDSVSREILPSKAQLYDWFWTSTAAGEKLRRIREDNLQHEDKSRAHVCGRFLVPTEQVDS